MPGDRCGNGTSLPDKLSPRYTDYARANASIGINGAVLNNVNADARIFTPEYLVKVAALANVWRPYGIRAYLSVNFAAPKTVGKLATADPLDASVADWWKAKADEIYKLIPISAAFSSKPIPKVSPARRITNEHTPTAPNVMADALAPHGGSRHLAGVCLRRRGRSRSRQAGLHRVHQRWMENSSRMFSCR